MLYFNSLGNRPNTVSSASVQQIMISHYATQGPGQHLLPGLEEATSDDNHLCSSVYSHSQTMTDPRSNSKLALFCNIVTNVVTH